MSHFIWRITALMYGMSPKRLLLRALSLVAAGSLMLLAGSILFPQKENASLLRKSPDPFDFSSSPSNSERVTNKSPAAYEEADTKWTFSESNAIKQRKKMYQYFDWWSLISLTKNKTKIGERMHFHYSSYKEEYPITEALHSLLPDKRLASKRVYDKCAIVGNGGILLNSDCGDEIDSSDYIFRCNFAPLSSFKRDVGQKTNLMTFNPSVIEKHYGNLSSSTDINRFREQLLTLRNVVLWVPAFFHHKVFRTLEILLKFLKASPDVTKTIQLAVPGNVFSKVIKFWKDEGIYENRLSTGILMYSIASGMCKEIRLYGFYPYPFYPYPYGKPVPYHYEDNRTNFDFGYKRYHDLPKEYEYFRKHHKEGALKLKVGKCTS